MLSVFFLNLLLPKVVKNSQASKAQKNNKINFNVQITKIIPTHFIASNI